MRKELNRLIFFAFVIPLSTYGQQYQTAVGFRFAREKGITLQQSIGNKLTLEGLLTAPDNGGQYSISVMLEKHINIIGRRLNTYVGVGPQMSFYKNLKNSYGVNSIAGMEWCIGRLNCSFDVKPLLHISGKSDDPIIVFQPGISIRYILIKRDSFWERAKKKINRFT